MGTPRLIAALRRRIATHPVTLVLGAGVSISCGVPSWSVLAERLAARAGIELPPGFASMHPLALPIVFELVEAALGDRPAFVEALRAELYASLAPSAGGCTLDVLASLLREEQARAAPRIRRVLTFNADDLLESEANLGFDAYRNPVVWPVCRESGRVRTCGGARGRAPIPVYHLHGFLPQTGPRGSRLDRHHAAHTLVFTEREYWASFAEPTSFPNRVIATALHDSICVFVGLSMADLNLARWLGVRSNAIERDRAEASSRSRRDALGHHVWITTVVYPRSGNALVREILARRGVKAVQIDAWGAPFATLVAELFG